MSAPPARRTDPQRFDSYTRWSVYTVYVLAPLLAIMVLTPVRASPWAPVYGFASLVEVALALVVTAKGFTASLEGRPVPRGWSAALLLAAAGLVVLALQLPTTAGPAGRVGAVALAGGIAVVALATALPIRTIVLGVLFVGLVAAVVAAGAVPEVREPGEPYFHPVAAFVTISAMVGGLAASVRVSAWMLRVVWEQERTRAVHARLAVAEERLRFSRDLHDVVGRALSAIAVKSELAAELARRGQDRATEEMSEVRALAQDTLREVRGVVAGYRAADLTAELDGARSVLRSAGVETHVSGDRREGLPQPVQEALGWVVREAVTNVLRHATARTCTIVLETDGPAVLTVTNDGVAAGPRGRGGSGLAGLRERLAPLGGDLTTRVEQDTFVLSAVVPLDRPGRDRTAQGRGAGTMDPT
ncbi:sensor histidine kinase [Georgenia alba]|uniref:Sensor histidine kinase n=1 Tax=Georgenia alba TaxID=2233858 RepID=A0ABW2Q7I3_9MICO